jgi:hypothetical protein
MNRRIERNVAISVPSPSPIVCRLPAGSKMTIIGHRLRERGQRQGWGVGVLGGWRRGTANRRRKRKREAHRQIQEAKMERAAGFEPAFEEFSAVFPVPLVALSVSRSATPVGLIVNAVVASSGSDGRIILAEVVSALQRCFRTVSGQFDAVLCRGMSCAGGGGSRNGRGELQAMGFLSAENSPKGAPSLRKSLALGCRNGKLPANRGNSNL